VLRNPTQQNSTEASEEMTMRNWLGGQASILSEIIDWTDFSFKPTNYFGGNYFLL